MLDERGVEWETDRSGFRVMWGKPVDEFHDTMQFKAVDNALPNGGLNVHICGFTPEQAIAATLGRGECEWELEHSGTLYDKWRCSECKFLFVEPRCDQSYTDLVLTFVRIAEERWWTHERLAAGTHTVQAMEQRATRARRVPQVRTREVREARASERLPEEGVVGVTTYERLFGTPERAARTLEEFELDQISWCHTRGGAMRNEQRV